MDWFNSLESETRNIIIGLIISVLGAIAGAIVKWLFDRELVTELRRQRQEARNEREAALTERGQAFQERKSALEELRDREVELRLKQDLVDKLQRELELRGHGVAEQESKLEKLITTLRGTEAGIWTTFPRNTPYMDFDARIASRKIIVLTVVNAKGGVGKTTIVANLACYFDKVLGKRVLTIDLDYQGSLTTAFRAQRTTGKIKSSINDVLMPHAGLGTLLLAAQNMRGGLSRTDIIPAFYELALHEDRTLVEWLLQQGGDDLRYRLAKVLWDVSLNRPSARCSQAHS